MGIIERAYEPLRLCLYGSVRVFVFFLKSTRGYSIPEVLLDYFIVASYIWMGRDKHNVPKIQENKVSTIDSKNSPERTKEFLGIYYDCVAKPALNLLKINT